MAGSERSERFRFDFPTIDPRPATPYLASVMTNLEILTIPDPVLRQKSLPVEAVNDATRRFMDEMLKTMYEAPGIGLAAIQVGEKRRIITIDVAREEEPRTPLFLVNPEIVWSSEDERSTYEEGCLSIPDYYAEVERPAKVRVRYVDYDGKSQEREVDGLLATCVQHEVDHLNGVLFIDYLSKLKRDLVVKKFTKAAREKERQRQHRI
jgi:peptide deformylase